MIPATHHTPSSRIRWGLAATAALAVIAGCNASTASIGPSTVARPVTSRPTPSPEPTSPSTTGAPATVATTAVPTALDPCELVPSAEASSLGGTIFGAGQASTTPGGAKLCSYGQEGIAIEVIVAQAPDAGTAQAAKLAAEAELKKNAAGVTMKVTELPGFAPGVDATLLEASATVAGQTYSATAIYLLKGPVFVGLSGLGTLGAKAPTSAAIQDEAKVVVGRLP